MVRFDARVGHADTGKIENGNKTRICSDHCARTILLAYLFYGRIGVTLHIMLLGDFVFTKNVALALEHVAQNVSLTVCPTCLGNGRSRRLEQERYVPLSNYHAA